MGVDSYRLWHYWQQMHYPSRGLPDSDALRASLITLDGTAGTLLDRYFRRSGGLPSLGQSALSTLTTCRRELDDVELSADAARYFGRLKTLIELVLADAPREPAAAVNASGVAGAERSG